MIPVYKGKSKEYHSLPPYADIERWDNAERCFGRREDRASILHGFRLDTNNLAKYSDGCLKRASQNFYWTMLEDLIGAAFKSIFQVVFWGIIGQIGFQIFDWIAEAVFNFDSIAGYSLQRFGLMLYFSPFAFYGGKFRMVPMKGFWAWFPYVLMLLLFFCDKPDLFSNRKKIQEEIERRKKL